MILILAMMIPTSAWACTETTAETGAALAFKEETVAVQAAETTYSDPAWWPLTEDHILAGIKDYGEKLHQDGVPTWTACTWPGSLTTAGCARITKSLPWILAARSSA